MGFHQEETVWGGFSTRRTCEPLSESELWHKLPWGSMVTIQAGRGS